MRIRTLSIWLAIAFLAVLVEARPLDDRRYGCLVGGRVGSILDARPGRRRIVSPTHGVQQHPAHLWIVIGRIGLVARTEIEDASCPALIGQARAEYLATLEPGDEDGLQRLRHGEGLAIHLL